MAVDVAGLEESLSYALLPVNNLENVSLCVQAERDGNEHCCFKEIEG